MEEKVVVGEVVVTRSPALPRSVSRAMAVDWFRQEATRWSLAKHLRQ